jgi:type III pantothenate kinase
VSVLVVDIGNTRIKWARVTNGRLSRQRAAAHADWRTADFAEQLMGGARRIDRVIVVSVAGARLDRRLVSAARRVRGIVPQFVATRRHLGGVTTAYSEPWRLGADRFVAAIGGHQLAPHRAVCVIDVGTAMTIDLVTARGRHVGGAIVPGPSLMVESLLHSTSGILHRSRGKPAGGSLFARNTRSAIEEGARYAVAAVIDRAVAEARRAVGAPPLVLLTGGAAAAVRPLVRSAHRSVPDLVLRGLAALI